MDLSAIAAVNDQKARTEQYRQACEHAISESSQQNCQQLVDHCAHDSIRVGCLVHWYTRKAWSTCKFIDRVLATEVPLVISRPVLLHFCNNLHKLQPDAQEPIATHALERMQAREVSFEEQRNVLRHLLAARSEDAEDWDSAARMLAAVDTDRVTPALTAAQKVAHFVKITMLFLEDDNAVDAERFFVKANALVADVDEPQLRLKYQACYARLADSKRRFLDAAMKYYELSQLGPAASSAEDVNAALQAAVTCAILAPAGSHRSRVLSQLYKDERVSAAGAVPQFPFLEKMLMERLITPEDVKGFSEMLKEHQKAVLSDGFTVLESAAVQHNIRSISAIYRNIALPQLAALLGLPEAQVEDLAAAMLTEGRLSGHIDHVDNIIFFATDDGPLAAWDEHIRTTCEAVDRILDVVHTTTAAAA